MTCLSKLGVCVLDFHGFVETIFYVCSWRDQGETFNCRD